MKKSIIIIILLLFRTAYAIGTEEIISRQLEASGIDGAYSNEEIDYSELTKQMISFEGDDAEDILSVFFGQLFEAVKESISLCLFVVIVVLVVNVIANVSGNGYEMPFYICYTIIFIMGVSSFSSASQIAKDSIDEMNFFMKAAIPVMGSLITASGGIVRTALMSSAVVGISATVSAISNILFPVSTMSALISGVGIFTGDNSLKGFSGGFKKLSLWGMGIIVTLFTTIITARSFVAVNLDNVSGKMVKYAAGNFVPVVGGMLSETLGSILACGRLVKGAGGTAAVMVLIYICLSPIVKLIAIIITYKLTAMMIAPISDGKIAVAIEEFTSSVVIILAMVIFTAAMFVICAGIVAAI